MQVETETHSLVTQWLRAPNCKFNVQTSNSCTCKYFYGALLRNMDNHSFGTEKAYGKQILAEEKSSNELQFWVKTELLL